MLKEIGSLPKAVERVLGVKVGNTWKELTDLKAICSESGHLYDIVSKNYELVQHEDVVKVVDEALKEMKVKPFKSMITIGHKGANMFYRLLLFQDVIREDKVGFGIMITNSYDRSFAINVLGYGLNFTCMNQMILGREILKIVKRHFRASIGTDLINVKEAIVEIIDSLQEISDIIKALIERKISVYDAISIIDGLNLSRKEELKVVKLLKERTGIKEIERYYWNYKLSKPHRDKFEKVTETLKEIELDKWDTYNVFTEYVTHHVKAKDYTKKFEMLNKVSAILVR